MIAARVTGADGTPLPGATCVISVLGKEAVAGPDGVCRFTDVPAGHFDISVRLSGYASARVGVDAAAGAPTGVVLAESLHFSESVTVSTQPLDTFEAYQPTSVLGGEELQTRLAGNLGDTLGSLPGVNVRALGPGASRPVIRGLDGDRVLVLENGARTGDLSSQSGDHGVTLDPASAGQIEVVRGPATLLYGSNALGGVVNLISDDVPGRPTRGLHGGVTAQGATANELASLAGSLRAGNQRWAVRAAGAASRSSDVATPAGTLPNSASEQRSAGFGFARTAPDGFLGAAYAYVDTSYGVPFVEEGETTLNPRRHRLDVRGERRGLDGFVQGLKFVGGYRNYRHDEIEGDGSVATSFANESFEGQLLLNHRPTGRLRGTLGLAAVHRDFSTAGQEALAPPVRQRSLSAFAYEELAYHHLGVQFGARVDRTRFDTETPEVRIPELPSRVDRAFTEVSGSLGLLGFVNDDFTVALNLARAARNPSLEELYNYGPHAGNFAFEVGDSELDSEVGLGADLTLRWRRPRFSGEVTLFGNWIDGFVFPLLTDDEADGFPVVRFTATDAHLRGLEAHLDLELRGGFALELGADGVRGEVRGGGGPLPRIPPYRGWLAVRYEANGFHVEGELRGAARQRRVSGLESATAGYGLVNLHASYKLVRGNAVHTFTLRLDNAGDRLWRNHLSFVKELTPEIGRSLRAAYGLRF